MVVIKKDLNDMDEIVRFNSKVWKVSFVAVLVLCAIQVIDSLDFYNDYFALASFFTLPFFIVSAIVFLYSQILEMKIETIKKGSNQYAK